MVDRRTLDQLQAQLLRRIATQDREALAELYDQFSGVLFSTAVRILGDSHEAEEVIQDVFVQIWSKAASFDVALGTPLHWVLSITRNRCIDRLRARERRTRLAADARNLTDAGNADSAGQPGLTAEELALVRASVETLPQEQRQAIELCFFSGMTHAEIAEALREPLGTVKARIRRGMLKLREKLQAHV